MVGRRAERRRAADRDSAVETRARSLIDDSGIRWHQRFELAPGIFTPGINDVDVLLDLSDVPDDLTGIRALDIGACNGGGSLELVRRGAAEVAAVDNKPIDWHGFDAVVALADGPAPDFYQASVYELPQVFEHRFDLILFWGVLYHLRHPVLALDSLRRLVTDDGVVLLESAVDSDLGHLDEPVTRFYRTDELNSDASNWFVPNLACLDAWCRSSGFDTRVIASWHGSSPEPGLVDRPSRALLELRPTPGEPEAQRITTERPLIAFSQRQHGVSGEVA